MQPKVVKKEEPKIIVPASIKVAQSESSYDSVRSSSSLELLSSIDPSSRFEMNVANLVQLIPKLSKSDDWQEWSDQVHNLLGMQGLLRYIVPRYYPADHQDAGLRGTIDRTGLTDENDIKVLCMLSFTLTQANRYIISGKTTAFEAFTALRQQYETSTGSKFLLMARLSSARVRDPNNAQDHVNYMSGLWVRLRAVWPECPEDNLVGYMMNSIAEGFPQIFGGLCARENLTYQQICEALLRCDAHKINQSPNNSAFYLHNSNNRGNSRGRSSRGSRRGGFTNNNNPRPTNRPAESSKNPMSDPAVNPHAGKECRWCHKLNHIESECRKKKADSAAGITQRPQRSQPQANVATNQPGQSSSSSTKQQSNFTYDFNYMAEYSAEESSEDECLVSTALTSPLTISLIVDSGSTTSVVNDASFLTELQPHHGCIKVGSGHSLPVRQSGILSGVANDIPSVFKNVLVAPGIQQNLLSLSKVTTGGGCGLFLNDKCLIFPPGHKIRVTTELQPIIAHKDTSGLYRLDLQMTEEQHQSYVIRQSLDGKLWHRRLACLHDKALRKLGFPEDTSNCIICAKAKLKIRPFPLTRHRSNLVPNRGLNFDLHGPTRFHGLENEKYIVVMVDYSSGMIFLQCLEHKSGAAEWLITTLKRLINQTGTTPEFVQSDKGGEFVGSPLRVFLESQGIQHNFSTTEAHASNGLVERANRTIMEKARAMLIWSGIPKRFWTFFITAAAYLANRSPSSRRAHKTPFELWYGVKPDLKHLRVMGCRTQSRAVPRPSKLEDQTDCGVFLGYTNTTTHYQIFNVTKQRIDVVRDIAFFEDVPGSNVFTQREVDYGISFPFWKISDFILEPPAVEPVQPPLHPLPVLIPEGIPLVNQPVQPPLPQVEQPEPQQAESPRPAATSTPQRSSHESSRLPPLSLDNLQQRLGENAESPPTNSRIPRRPSISTTVVPPTSSTHELRRSTRSNIGNKMNTVMDAVRHRPKPHESHFTFRSDLMKINSNKEQVSESHEEHQSFIVNWEPTSTKEAMEDDEWYESIQQELKSMVDREVFVLVPRPTNRQVIGTKFVFKVKRNQNNEPVRAKTRLVAQGFRQIQDEDFYETFASVVRYDTVRTVLAIMTQNQLHAHHFDVTTAFLHAPLQEEVFVEQPPLNHHHQFPSHVWKLLRAIYGLRQSPNAWFVMITKTLQSLGFEPTSSDPCLFIKMDQIEGLAVTILLLLFVDDIVVLSSSILALQRVFTDLRNQQIDLTFLGEVTNFISLNIEYDKVAGICRVGQPGYLLKILKKFNCDDLPIANTPMRTSMRLVAGNIEDERPDYPYRSAIGSLQFLAQSTRPDISFAVSHLAQFSTTFNDEHVLAVQRVFQYLKGTKNYCISYFRRSHNVPHDLTVRGFVDANWGGLPSDNGRSTTGYVIFLCCGPILWSSTRQTSVALSTAESESLAICKASTASVWTNNLLKELQLLPPEAPFILSTDSTAASQSCQHPTNHGRMRHVMLSLAFIRDLSQKSQVLLQTISGNENVADILTKPLPEPLFLYHRLLLVALNDQPQQQAQEVTIGEAKAEDIHFASTAYLFVS